MTLPPDDQAFVDAYVPSDYPRPSVTVDLVVFTVLDGDLKVLLVQRKRPPFSDQWAFPGSFLRVGGSPDHPPETLDQAARRALKGETGVSEGHSFLEQLFTFGAIDRDPRMRVITVAYFALIRPDAAPLIAGRDESAVQWFSVANEIPQPLAFDHEHILDSALQRIRGKVDYSNIAFRLVPTTFTIAELRGVHEAIKGTNYDPGNFRRRFNRMQTDGVLELAVGKRQTDRRPAKIYRFAGVEGD